MLDGMGRDEMRAADSDRQQVAARLQAALDEGRLDLAEYDERLQRAYAAKTYGELDGLLTDLPAVPATTAVGPAAVPIEDHVTRRWLLQVWSSWIPAVAVTTAVWLATSVASGHPGYYWPIWVAGPWGAVLLWQTISGLAGGEPRRQAVERARKEQARQLRRERRTLEAGAASPGPSAASHGSGAAVSEPGAASHGSGPAVSEPGAEATEQPARQRVRDDDSTGS
ncbi:hypothetical protein KRMM14A1259_54010 [Krasilnikovia sp. MM14-A1259]